MFYLNEKLVQVDHNVTALSKKKLAEVYHNYKKS
jgi:hypothetical protein